MAELRGKVALVVGASRGVGLAYSLALSRAGVRVAAAARTVAPPTGEAQAAGGLAGLVATAADEGGEVVAVRCDVEHEDDVIRLVDQTLATFGRIDIVVNNAGVYPHFDALQVPLDQWNRIMRVNLTGPYLVIRHAAPHMAARRSGSIINITSRSARATRRGTPAHTGLLTYGVSKAALDRLTTFLAAELYPFGIAVNALSPGGVLTETWRQVAPEDFASAERAGTAKAPLPELLGPALLYLAGQSAQTMTGKILHTDEFGKSWPAGG
jgi:NAD(P)-dependent dehydrogenase (short-subunit alcohol dehydrogenase family)